MNDKSTGTRPIPEKDGLDTARLAARMKAHVSGFRREPQGAKFNRANLARYGFWHHGSCEHCHPGFGDENWADIIKELRRQGYHGDLNIEGWHDYVFRDQQAAPPPDIVLQDRPPVAPNLEDAGLIIALRHLQQWCPEGF